MDTTFPGNALMTRAVTSPVLLTIAYWSIILTEGVTGLLLALGAIRMLTNVNAPAARFETAKRFVAIGAGLGFMLWFTGFMVIGGEWFAMWQSQTWNGQEAAFRFYMTLLAVLIFVNQTDSELPNREGEVG
jgi:predicted small integral membrane protein